ncbi:MAG TPA: serine hydrolase domain-containing protein, partial [Longimicrobiales bacterium]
SVARLPLMFSPGTGWNYSSGIDIAARVIEVASGEPLDRFLEAEVFRPLGMSRTSFRWTPELREHAVTLYHYGPDGRLQPSRGTGGLAGMYEPEARFLWGSGGLLSTPDDYLRFAQMLLNGGSFGGVRILRPETVALMTRDQLPPALSPASGGPLPDEGYGFGLAVAVLVDAARAHRPGPNGIFRWSGYVGTYFWVDPRSDMVAMVWTQLSPGNAVPLEDTFQRLVYGGLAPAPAAATTGDSH